MSGKSECDDPDVRKEVERQLNLTMPRIEEGATPWRIDQKDLDELREHYLPGFCATWKTWPRDEKKVLRLARWEGSLAALIAEAFYEGKDDPQDTMHPACLWLAAFLVQIDCPEHVQAKYVMGTPRCPPIPLSRLDWQLIFRLQRLLALLFGLHELRPFFERNTDLAPKPDA